MIVGDNLQLCVMVRYAAVKAASVPGTTVRLSVDEVQNVTGVDNVTGTPQGLSCQQVAVIGLVRGVIFCTHFTWYTILPDPPRKKHLKYLFKQ